MYLGTALQRRVDGDRARWRTVGRIKFGQEKQAVAACIHLAAFLEPVRWRIVRDNNLQTVLKEFERGSNEEEKSTATGRSAGPAVGGN